jgi:hypothetical protein
LEVGSWKLGVGSWSGEESESSEFKNFTSVKLTAQQNLSKRTPLEKN